MQRNLSVTVLILPLEAALYNDSGLLSRSFKG